MVSHWWGRCELESLGDEFFRCWLVELRKNSACFELGALPIRSSDYWFGCSVTELSKTCGGRILKQGSGSISPRSQRGSRKLAHSELFLVDLRLFHSLFFWHLGLVVEGWIEVSLGELTWLLWHFSTGERFIRWTSNLWTFVTKLIWADLFASEVKRPQW